MVKDTKQNLKINCTLFAAWVVRNTTFCAQHDRRGLNQITNISWVKTNEEICGCLVRIRFGKRIGLCWRPSGSNPGHRDRGDRASGTGAKPAYLGNPDSYRCRTMSCWSRSSTKQTLKGFTMTNSISEIYTRFLKSEDGAVTVDFVVLTAAIVVLGLAIGTSVSRGVVGLANDIEDTMVDMAN